MPPVALLTRFAKLKLKPRFPERASDRCDSEHPAMTANCRCVMLWPAMYFANSMRPSISEPSMSHFGTSKVTSQALTLPIEDDRRRLSTDHAWMPRQPSKDDQPELFIGQWLSALGIRARDVARGAHINEGYLSQLISGDKVKPTAGMVKKIGDYLKIYWRDLYRRPPSRDVIKEASTLDPAVLARLYKRHQ
jgi:hypothetical protein